jgi:hypothetical protein
MNFKDIIELGILDSLVYNIHPAVSLKHSEVVVLVVPAEEGKVFAVVASPGVVAVPVAVIDGQSFSVRDVLLGSIVDACLVEESTDALIGERNVRGLVSALWSKHPERPNPKRARLVGKATNSGFADSLGRIVESVAGWDADDEISHHHGNRQKAKNTIEEHLCNAVGLRL